MNSTDGMEMSVSFKGKMPYEVATLTMQVDE